MKLLEYSWWLSLLPIEFIHCIINAVSVIGITIVAVFIVIVIIIDGVIAVIIGTIRFARRVIAAGSITVRGRTLRFRIIAAGGFLVFFLLLEVVVGSGLGTMIRTVDRTGVLLTIAAALGALVLFANPAHGGIPFGHKCFFRHLLQKHCCTSCWRQ